MALRSMVVVVVVVVVLRLRDWTRGKVEAFAKLSPICNLDAGPIW
jgi:hypothetical protein